MKLTVTTNEDLFTLEIPPDIELENLKAYCEAESGIPATEITLLLNGQPLTDDKKTVEQYGLNDGEMIFLQRNSATRRNPRAAAPQIDFSGIRPPSAASTSRQPQQDPRQNVDPLVLREMLLANEYEVASLRQSNPRLAEALLSGDPAKFVEVFTEQMSERRREGAERMALMTGDPFDPEIQKRIAEAIQQENVNANMEAAMEHAPESFGQVHMLYINCKVNGHNVKAFVDSGAQMTIMSKACAERCNIIHLMDRRWAGVAKGVGVQRILGRIHICQISIGNDHLQCSFSILEDQPMDMLLGLDMLKRHQCCIDLRDDTLIIGTTSNKTSFLTEAELPDYARLNRSISQIEQDKELAEAMLKSSEESNQQRPNASRPQRQQQPQSTSRTPPAATTSPYPEVAVQTLIANGFSREQAVTELGKTNGNVEVALMNLLARSIAVPKS